MSAEQNSVTRNLLARVDLALIDLDKEKAEALKVVGIAADHALAIGRVRATLMAIRDELRPLLDSSAPREFPYDSHSLAARSQPYGGKMRRLTLRQSHDAAWAAIEQYAWKLELCCVTVNAGPFNDPVACAFKADHPGDHSWASLTSSPSRTEREAG